MEGYTAKRGYTRRLEFPEMRFEFWDVIYGLLKRKLCRFFCISWQQWAWESNGIFEPTLFQTYAVSTAVSRERVITSFWSYRKWHKLLSVNADKRALYAWKMIYLILKILIKLFMYHLLFSLFFQFCGTFDSFFLAFILTLIKKHRYQSHNSHTQ